MRIAFASDWPRRRYSYAAVLALTALGLAFPAAAGGLMALLLAVGMVLLGVAHGACDQFVVPGGQVTGVPTSGWRYWLAFLVGYLGLAGAVGLLWWRWPAATVGLFFGMTVWHWGSADAAPAPVPRLWWLASGMLRGLLPFVVPAVRWPTETAGIINHLLGFVGAAAMPAGWFARVADGLAVAMAAGYLVLWAVFLARRRWDLLPTELLEALVLVLLFVALPPQFTLGIYFVFWHSLQHVLRMTGWLGYPATAGHPTPARAALLPQLLFFLRRAAPLLLVSCAALAVLGRLLAPHLHQPADWLSLALVVASLVTLPHALLVTVVMDAGYWQRPQPNAAAG